MLLFLKPGRTLKLVRVDGRANDELRKVQIIPGVLSFAEGSAMIELGLNRVICSVSIEDRVPPFLRGKGGGWVTAEYSMLPRATLQRTPREAATGRVAGRTQEIQRLIGRSLRAVTDLPALGERTLIVDCDVIQADGGTRTAAITASYVAMYQAFYKLKNRGAFFSIPLKCAVAATSVGVLNGEALLDLCYEEDCRAEVDFNVVMTDNNQYVEVQGTAEGEFFSRETTNVILDLAQKGIEQLLAVQRTACAAIARQQPK